MLTACPNGSDPLAGDFNYNESDDSTPYEVNTPLCYEGSISISSNRAVTINANVFSASGNITLGSTKNGLTVNQPITSEAGGITFEADDVLTINAAVEASDEIEITAHKDLDVYANIVSEESTVTLEAVHKRVNSDISALDQLQDLASIGSGQLHVTIGGSSDAVLISGFKGVTITAEAGINDTYAIGKNPYFKNIAPVIMEAFSVPDLFTLPVSVQVWKPQAELTATNSTIVASDGEVTVSAIAEANAKGKAVWNRVIGTGKEAGTGLGFDKGGGAAGLYFTDATATVDIVGTTLSASESVEVSSEITNTIELEVNAITNNGLSNTNPSSVAIGFGLTDLRTTSTVNVDENSLISSGGNVTVKASAEDDNSNSVKASSYRDGVVGAAAGFTYTDATVSAVVDGKITMAPEAATEESGDSTGESSDSPAVLDFNPALQVDFSNSSLHFTGTTAYETGDAVLFTSEDNGTIPGLIPGTVYYLIVAADSEPDTFDLQFAATAEDANSGEAISFGASFPTLTNARTGVEAPITITVVDAEGRHLILFGYSETLTGEPLYDTGDSVIYTSTPERFLGYRDSDQNVVPLGDATYQVEVVDSPFEEQYPLAVELQLISGAPILLNGASYLQNTSGTRYPITSYNTASNTVDLSTLSIDAANNEVVATPPGDPVQQGESLVFHSGLNENVTTLIDGTTYYAIVDANNEGVIQLATSLSQATSSDPSIQTQQASLTAEVDGVPVTVPIGNFEMGMGLSFSDNPNLPDGTEVVYHAVPEKPINGLTDGATYLAYNIDNVEFNSAVPQYLMGLVSPPTSGLDAPPASNLSSNADSGSFTLTITDSQGGQGTTHSIAWDATSDELADAIASLELPDVSVLVSGHGTTQSPWLIQGLNASAITVNASQLLQGASAANVSLQQAEMGSVLASQAVSGTFTLTVTDSSDQSATTSPLAWNSTPAELEAALNGLVGLSVRVSGMGNPVSPWRVEGLLPSQVTIDSTNLLNELGDQATMQLTADLQAGFWYGQTLQTGNDLFTISGAQLDNNDLSLLLTDPAPIVANDGSGLSNDSLSVSAVASDAIQMFSFADGGSFTLTITDPRSGTITTTSPIAWNAEPTQVASAITSSSGLAVNVIGGGTIQSPWLVSGLNGSEVQPNNENLLNGSSQANLLYRAIPSGSSLVSTDADSGTFTLTFSDGSGTMESNPIAYDANAGEVTDVLRGSLTSVQVEVTGMGTPEDPWLIISLAQPIQTGDALTFNDSWDLPSLGLVNGQTYYAVVQPAALDATMVIVGLSESPGGAISDPPTLVPLSSSLDLVSGPSALMTGAEESIAPIPEAVELEIASELESGDSISSSSLIGGRPMLGYYVDGSKNLFKTRKLSDKISAIDHEIDERTPEHLKAKVNPFSLTFGISVLDARNQSQAVVGNTSQIGVQGEVSITSDLKETVHSSANASLAKQSSKNHGDSSAVAVASTVALLNNSSQAVIESDAEVTGTEGVAVASEVTYPVRDSIPGAYNPSTGQGGSWNEAYGILKSLALNPTVNAVESWFFNTSTNVGIKGVGTDENDSKRLSFILTGSFSVQDITNRNLAQIADGAQINQSLTDFSWYDTSTNAIIGSKDLGELEDTNSVSIEATSDLSQRGIAGQLYIGLNLLTLGSKDIGNNVLPFRKSSRNAFGGSANFVIFSEETQALLGGADPEGNVPQQSSTNVTYGSGNNEEPGLSVVAEASTEFVEIAQSAAHSSGVGVEASTAYLLMGENDDSDADRGKFTYAEMNSENYPIELVPVNGTDGEVEVKADDSSDLWAVSGAVMLGATKGVGISASVIELNRDAAAGVGSRTSKTSTKATNRKQAAGDITIEATVDGTVMPLSLVGSVASTHHEINDFDSFLRWTEVPGEDGHGGASSLDGNWGIGVSGDFAGAFVNDQAYAYLDSPGTISGIESTTNETNSLEISASNNTIMNPVAGQATIALASGDEGALAGIAGSAAVAIFQSSVQATLADTTVADLALDLKADNQKKIGTCAAGLQVQAPKGSDLQIAGSVVVNEITNTTIASILNVDQSDSLGEIALTSLQADETWGGAGTAAVTFDRRSDKPHAKTAVGVGMSAVWNQIDNTTTAQVCDSTLNQTEGSFDVTAEDFTSSRVLSAGVNVTVPAGMSIEIGGMWATNYVTPNTTAQIDTSTIKNTSTDEPLNVVAVLAPFLDSFAGYFSLEFGKPLSSKETQLGIGVGAAVVVTRLGPKETDGTALPTLAEISSSNVNRTGDITVRAFTGALDETTETFVPDQNVVESLVGETSLHALAIAGSAQGENSAESQVSAGVIANGAVVVTDLKINTQATVTNNTSINANNSVPESASTVQVLANNQLDLSTDAGGASVSESGSLSGTAVDIAVGGADNSFTSANQTSATVTGNASVTAETVSVIAQHSPSLDHVAFGVAVSAAVSTSGTSVAFGFSGSFLQTDISDQVLASTSDSTLQISETITIEAIDQTALTTGSGSGSLQVSFGADAGVALSPSAVTNQVTVGNTVLAWMGQKPLSDQTLIDTSVTADGSSVTAGEIKVSATCDQDIQNTAIAVTVSVAIAPEFDSVAASGSGASSTVTTNNVIKAAVNGVSDLSVSSTEGLNVLATDSGTVDITVGVGAASVGWFGGSVGISLAEISNNDHVVAEVQNSIIENAGSATEGSPIKIQAEDTVKLTTDSVATSLSISIGAAGAGGNSNITSNACVAASFGDGSQVTVAPGSKPGDLTVQATGSETLLAEIFGGTLGLGSIGVFNSDAKLEGSTEANLDAGTSLDVDDLTVIAATTQDITSQGMSVTVGGLAGTGENHDVTVSESVTTNFQGQNQQWNVVGDLIVQSDSQNTATAQTSGSGGNGEDISASLMGVGFFKVNSNVSPTVSLNVSEVDLNVTGQSTFATSAINQNNTEAKSGSGSLVGGDAAKATTTNSPDVTLTITKMDLNSGSTTISGSIDTDYSTQANSVYATEVGGSAARSYNTSEPVLRLSIGSSSATESDTTIQASGTVDISANNRLLGIGDGNSKNAAGFMARVGAGGGISGFGGTANSTTTSTSSIELNDHVSIQTNDGNVQIGSTNDWESTQLTHMGTGGAINGAGVQSILDSTLNNTITLGSDVQLVVPNGQIAIGTNNNSATTSNADSYTFGLAGGSNSDSSNNMNSNQTVTIGENSTLHAGGQIVVTAGYNPKSQSGTLLDVYAVVTARCAGLLEIPTTTADASSTVNNSVTIDPGTSIISHSDVEFGAVPGINNASWYTFANIDGAKGKVHQGTDGLTETNEVSFDGEVVAGNMNSLSVVIPSSGDTISVNTLINSQPIDDATITLQPAASDLFDANESFLSFQVQRNPSYDATQLLDGLDSTSQAILKPDISEQPVVAITLTGLEADGGQAVVHAGTLSGSGTVTAKVPSITISNSSPAYLLLEGVEAANTLNMGQVNIMGGAGKPDTMTFMQTNEVPEITIAQTYPEAVPDSSAGPAIAVQKAIVNTAGSVQITNDMGALVQAASINAKSVSISTPNSAFIVNTPADYYGSSGDIIDYWTPEFSLTGSGTFESPSTDSFIYNPTGSNWTFTGSSGLSTNGSGFTSQNPDAPQGTQVAFLQEKGQISQFIDSMTDGMSYVMQFKAAQRADYPNQSFEIALDGQSLCTIMPSSTSYETYSCSFEVPAKESIDSDSLLLTDGVTNMSRAFWYQDRIELPESGTISIDFIYQAGGDRAADGITLAFQNTGVNAIGNTGGSLGYVGIASPTAAYQINLYDGYTQGSNFVTTNTSGTYLPTSPVDFNNGNEISVQLVYDADASTLTETLTDSTANTTYSHTYEDIDLRNLLGDATYIGFTGGDGASTSTQTVSDFSMTINNSLDPSASTSLQDFSDWEINGTRWLTLTGLEPSGQDETVFLDELALQTNPAGFVPGLNSYVTQYTASLAATTAATALYIDESNADGSDGTFSNWLYNTGGDYATVNYDVRPGSIGDSYPKHASDNYGTTQYGSGIIFFGSQIPYLWPDADGTTVSSGSDLLTDGLGYQDTLSNAQKYSVAATQNPADYYKNITQGTGPQNDDASPGKGIFPVLPADFPTSVSVTNPSARSLGGSGITAGSLDVTARYLDINGPIDVGSVSQTVNVVLGSDINQQIAWYQSDYDNGTQPNATLDLDSYFGDSGITGYYDALSAQIFLDPYAINAGVTEAVFTGAIISTTEYGTISVHSDPGDITISNQTDYPLVLATIAASDQDVAGIVLMNDTLTNQSTAFVYSPENDLQIYQGELHADVKDMSMVGSSTTDSAAFQPGSNESSVAGSVNSSELAYQWTDAAWISRDLNFSVNPDGSYDLAHSTDDTWQWGPIAGSSNSDQVETNPFPSVNTLLLSDGQTDDANAYWYPFKFVFPDDSFTVQFTYQAAGERAADGITFAFQNEAADAIGGIGGDLGYVGISPNTAAYQINLYDAYVQGSNFVTTNSSGNYLSTDPVNFNSGNPIEVNLTFDPSNNSMVETLTDSSTNETYTRTHYDIDLSTLLGASSYIGFTGGDGGATSIQTVTDFSMTSIPADFASWNGLSHEKILQSNTETNATQTVQATITQTETAVTHFASSSTDAWDMGPSTEWSWTYPTEILLQVVNQVPAANPISLDFGGVQSGSLTVNSNTELQLTGNIIFPGSVSLSSTEDLTQAPNAVIFADQLDLASANSTVGQEESPINIDIDSANAINATADAGIYLSSDSDFPVGQLLSSNGPVEVTTAGNLTPALNDALIEGTNITLQVEDGSIASQTAPLTIQTHTSQLESGTIVDGLLTAAAQDSIFLVQDQGALRLHSVTTSAPLGVVSITNQNGSITDGNRSDVFKLNQFNRQQAIELIKQIKVTQENSATATVTAFEASVNQKYLQYWTLLPENGSYDDQTGTFVLNSDGIAYYQSQANLYVTEQANATAEANGSDPPGDILIATPTQVQEYGNTLYQNSVAVFENDLVFGPDWKSQDQFSAYNPDYTFVAREDVIVQLTYGSVDLSNSFAMLSLDALSPIGSLDVDDLDSAIQTTILNLNAGRSIGLPFHVIEFDYSDLVEGTLTADEMGILTSATSAGELQIVGVNSSGERVLYSEGSRPEGVTPDAVMVRIDKPLHIDLAVDGIVQVQANESINLTEVLGDLSILYAETPLTTKIVAQESIVTTPLKNTPNGTGWSVDQNGVLGYTNPDQTFTSTGLILESPVYDTGIIANGSFETPVQSPGGFTYNPTAPDWTFTGYAGITGNESGFTGDNPAAPLGTQVAFIEEQGVMSQQINGLVSGQAYTLEFEVAQRANYPSPTFTVDIDGQILTTQTPSSTSYEPVSVDFVFDTTSLEMTDGQLSEARGHWYQTPLVIHEEGQMTVEFTYQSGGERAADGVTFAFQNKGVDALGASGGSLGYVGILGHTAAYQINLYDGYVQGSNFVTTNTSENYLPTSPVSFNSGNPIQVQLVFDADQQTVTETLTDTVSQSSFTRTYPDIDLSTVFTDNAYIGFTGSDGGASSTQNITDFKLWKGDRDDSPMISGFGGWSYTGQHTLTFTGVDPSTVDQTAFIDGVKLVRSPGIITGDLRLVSGAAIGYQGAPMNIQVGGGLDAFTTNDLFLSHQSTNNLRLNTVFAGGESSIEAAAANIFSLQDQIKGTVVGFGPDGAGDGWDVDSNNGSTSFSDNRLTLTNDGEPEESSASWESVAGTQLDDLVTVEGRFIASFVYEADNSPSDLEFVLASSNTDVTTLTQTSGTTGTPTFSLVLESQCQDCSTSSAVGILYNGELTSTPVPDNIGLSSGNPVHVTMAYESLANAVSITLATADDSFTFDVNQLDMLRILGTNKARIGFRAEGDGQASTQVISDFNFVFGVPTINSASVTLTSGLQIGAPQTPILLLAADTVASSAPDGIYLTQINGDLFISSTNSDATVHLSAPTGSVLASTGSSTGDSILILGSGLQESASAMPNIQAADLAISSLNHLGALNNVLDLGVSNLTASTVFGDLHLNQTGDLLISDPIQAGAAIHLVGDSLITVAAKVHAESEIQLRTEGDAGSLHFVSGGHLLSRQGEAQLFVGRSLIADIGSILESASGLTISGGGATLGPAESHRMQVLGSVRGGPLQILSNAQNDSLQIAMTDLMGESGDPLDVTVGNFSNLHLDDNRSSPGREFLVLNKRIETNVANLELGNLTSLVMNLGSGPDSFRSEPTWQMDSLEINDAGGTNEFEIAGVAGGQPQVVSLNGGSEHDQLMIDGNGTPIWIADGLVHLGDLIINHTEIEKLLVENELSLLRPEPANTFEIEPDAVSAETLTVVGTGGTDDLFFHLDSNATRLFGLWNETHNVSHNFDPGKYDALRAILLGGNDSLLVDGRGSIPLFVEGGPDDDWIQVEIASDTTVLDLEGNNVIKTDSGADDVRTGPGNDKINAGDGQNVVHDAGGINWIRTGIHDDGIQHANANDFISASDGINKIWLNDDLQGWHNPNIQSDVNRDSNTTSLDALLIINRLAVVDFTGETGRYFFPGSADSLDMFYDANDDGYMSTLDCIFVLNVLAEEAANEEGEMSLVLAPVDIPRTQVVSNGNKTRATDEYFANWNDDVRLPLTTPEQDESALLDAWAQENLRRRLELKSILSDTQQREEEDVGLELLTNGFRANW